MFCSWISSSEHVLSPAHTNPVVLYWALRLGQEGNERPTPSHWHLWEKTQGLISLTINLDKPIVPQCWWFHGEGLLLVHAKWACTGCILPATERLAYSPWWGLHGKENAAPSLQVLRGKPTLGPNRAPQASACWLGEWVSREAPLSLQPLWRSLQERREVGESGWLGPCCCPSRNSSKKFIEGFHCSRILCWT